MAPRVPNILKGRPLGEAETHQEQVGVRVDKAAKKQRIEAACKDSKRYFESKLHFS